MSEACSSTELFLCPRLTSTSDGFLMKLTENSCSYSGFLCLFERHTRNTLPAEETCRRSIPFLCLLCENRSSASSSATPDFGDALWLEQMLNSNQAYALIGGMVFIGRFSWSSCEDIFPDCEIHSFVFFLCVHKFMTSNIVVSKHNQLWSLRKVHCAATALCREVYSQIGGHGYLYSLLLQFAALFYEIGRVRSQKEKPSSWFWDGTKLQGIINIGINTKFWKLHRIDIVILFFPLLAACSRAGARRKGKRTLSSTNLILTPPNPILRINLYVSK